MSKYGRTRGISKAQVLEDFGWPNGTAKKVKPTPAELREKHPGLKEAWEKYQLLLKLYRE